MKDEGYNNQLPAISKGANYGVGYGKPPTHSRFKPGRSGNPKGRPRGAKNKSGPFGRERLKEIVLAEAYREVSVSEGNKTVKLPVMQSVIRTLSVKAAKGDYRSQRLLTEMLTNVEREAKQQYFEELETAILYKCRHEEELQRCKAMGRPAPLLLPHPDDVRINTGTGEVRITGPLTHEQKVAIDQVWQRKAGFEDDLAFATQMLADESDPKMKTIGQKEIHHAERMVGLIAQILPDEDYDGWIKRYPPSSY
jgi:hypothetical protein